MSDPGPDGDRGPDAAVVPMSITLPPEVLDRVRLISWGPVPRGDAIVGDVWIGDPSQDLEELRERATRNMAILMGVPEDVLTFGRPREARLPRWWLAFIRIGRVITDRL